MCEIRALGPEDAEAYWNIRLEALETEPLAFGSAAEEHRRRSVDEVARQLQDVRNGNFMLGGFLDGELVGITGFVRHERIKTRHRGDVVGVYVRPNARGRGCARRMMEHLLARVRSYDGLEWVWLTVASEATAARALYRTLGFSPYGTLPQAIKDGDRYADLEEMGLKLA